MIEVGVSVSAAAAILFSGLIISVSVFFAVFDSTTNKLINYSQRSYDDDLKMMQTDISITNATYNWITLTLSLKIINTGSIELDATKSEILIDGILKTDMINWTKSTIDTKASHIWAPRTIFYLELTSLSYPLGQNPERIKVVTENGVSDYTTDIYITP